MEVKGSEGGWSGAYPMKTAKRKTIPVDKDWHFKQAGNGDSTFLPVAQFPTNVHLDLLHHGLIPDPYIGKNENVVQWVGEKKWVYRTTFPSPESPACKSVLSFEGLDTYATVLLNGYAILETKDMFIPERVNVTTRLIPQGMNHLEITFDSTYLIGKKIIEPRNDHKWGCWNGDPSRLAVRKAQYHYGWDWGPALLTCGPWRPINLEAFTARIADLYFRTNVDLSWKSAEIVANAVVEGEASAVRFEVSLEGKLVSVEVVKVKDNVARAVFKTQNPALWYPTGYGKQSLYVLKAELLSGGSISDETSKRFGLRRAEVVQHDVLDATGNSFFFRINGIPIFCGGSNWIPPHLLIPSVTTECYRDWVKVLVKGGQNMLRVWGGGIYEQQALYDACDDMGVLVWQDFMFACGNYPADLAFLRLVEREATENVKRLRHHPCIVLWAGNNEDYQYRESENLGYDPDDHEPSSWLKSTWPARYIYEKVLVDVTKELIPDTYYHFGSPFSSRTKPTTDQTVGDLHQWNVWHGTQEPYQNFSTLAGRFVSEFGMEALPSLSTIQGFLSLGSKDPDNYPSSSTISFHNKAAGHSRRLALYLAENLRYSFHPFEQYIYCTQLLQSEALSTAYHIFRRRWKGPGREYCGGALVWQLNDVWPGTSWAIVDYHLRPKLAYYAIKREMAPFTVGIQRTAEEIPADKYTRAYVRTVRKLEIWASNLSLTSPDVEMRFKAWDIQTGRQLQDMRLHVHSPLPQNQSTEIKSVMLPLFRQDDPDAHLRTVCAVYLTEFPSQALLARTVNWPEPLKYIRFPPNARAANLRIDVVEDGRAVLVQADLPIKGLQLETLNQEPGGEVEWEDNGLDIVPGKAMRVGIEGLRGRPVEARWLGMQQPEECAGVS